jgi:Glycoside hydrolase 123, catalytic domain/Glycoside hydrolase 123 N-terminal domain
MNSFFSKINHRFLGAAATLLLLALPMTARAGSAPGPVQVWNCKNWQTVSLGDFAGVNKDLKALKAIKMIAPRNGVAAGYVVVTRDGGAIQGLKATAGDFKNTDGKVIGASQIMVRYAALAANGKSWMPRFRFDLLLDEAPKAVAAIDLAKLRIRKFSPKNKGLVATMPVWISVRVPADAAPGQYQGQLLIKANGLAGGVKVPVKLTVYDWKISDPKDFRVRTIGWLNPEALAKHYNLKLWSDKHFEYMGKSMELMLELGSRHLPLDFSKGYPARANTDTMVKWIKQADGSYKYDFTLFDKYCDLAASKIGNPFPVRLNIWRGPRNGGGGEKDDYPNSTVLVLDPATKKVTELAAPSKLGSEEMKKFWKPFMDQLRVRLEKRGWFGAAGPNWMCYCGGMTPEMASMVKSIWPDGQWTDVTHGRVRSYRTKEKGVRVLVFVQSTVWNEGTLNKYLKWKSGPYPRQYAGKLNPKTAYCTHARNQYRESINPKLWILRSLHDLAILKGNDGIESVGVDHFPAKDARGRFRPGSWSAYAQGPKNGTLALLGPGEKGPLRTERFEAMRAGIQLSEALVYIQKVIEAKKISGDLLVRANKALDDRARTMVGSWKETMVPYGKRMIKRVLFQMDKYASTAEKSDHALYSMAAEVQKAVEKSK